MNVEDWKFNEVAVIECFRNKREKKRFPTSAMQDRKDHEASDCRRPAEPGFQDEPWRLRAEVAKMLTQRIVDRDLQLKPIRQFQRVDGLTQKLRDICQESPEQQVFEYIAVFALKPLFRAKILPVQYGSIPKKGGVAGKRKIERLLRKKFHGKVVAIKGDVTKAYPSVTVDIVMEMLRRDIGKNKVTVMVPGCSYEQLSWEASCVLADIFRHGCSIML